MSETGGAGASEAKPVPLGALRHRGFRILWIGSLISNVGTWMHVVAQGWLMYALTDSPLWLGLTGLMRAIPLLAFPLLGGVLADRLQRLTLLYATQGAALLLAAALGSVTVLGLTEPWHLLAFSFLTATAQAFDNPARQALLPDLVASDDMMSAVSLNSWSFNGAVLMGPALAAALLPLIGIGGVFFLNAASFAAMLIALSFLRVPRAEVPLGSARRNLLDGLRHIADSPALSSLVAMTAIVSLLGRSYGQLMPVFARDFLNLDATGMSLLYTVAGLGTCVGATALILLHNPGRKGRVALGAGLVLAASLALFALSRSLWLSELALFVTGAALIAFSTSVTTLLQRLAPKEMRGRIMSVNTMAWQGLEYAGVLITGGLATLWAAPPVLVGAAVIIALALVGIALACRAVTELD